MKIKFNNLLFRQRNELLKFIMRTFIFLLCSTAFGFTSSDIFSQNTKIRIDKDQVVSIDEVFDLLRDQTDYTFIYQEDLFEGAPKVQLKKGVISANKLLETCFSGKDFELNFNGKKIIIVRSNIPNQDQQGFDITGTVLDTKGQPLPGANIVERGTTNGVQTDFDGNFLIEVTDGNAVLVISYLGFSTKEVLLDGQTAIKIILQEDAAGLDEVVVIGYGSVKKSDLTGSVASVSGNEMTQVVNTSFDQGLQGRAAGVSVSQTSGQPGGVNTVRIRGGNSIQAGNEPLYVIDGFPVYNENPGANSLNAPPINALSTLNPGDIQSVEVLKDASATAIYGSRGANGVIIITTKRGSEGKAQIEYSHYSGLQTVRKKLDVLNAKEFALFTNEANRNGNVFYGGNLGDTYTQEQIDAYGEGTDWQDEIFRTALIQDHQLSITGGSEKTKYAISGNLFKQEGTIINSDFERASFRINLDQQINDRLKIGNSLTMSRIFANQANTGGNNGGRDGVQDANGSVVAAALLFNPILPVRNEVGEYTFQNNHVGETEGANNGNVPYYNPVQYANEVINENINLRVLGNIFAEYRIGKNLDLRVSGGVDSYSNKQNSYIPSTVRTGAFVNGEAAVSNVNTLTWINENTITYANTFNTNHAVNLLGGISFQGSNTELNTTNVRNFTNDLLTFNDLSSGGAPLTEEGPAEIAVDSDQTSWFLSSYFVRGNYGLKNKYLLTLTARTDASSRFGSINKYGFFPSGALAWKVSEESFLKDNKSVSNFKIRTSYGLTGNQEIPLYRNLSALGTTIYPFGSTIRNGFQPIRIGNDDLKWETTSQFNVGMDLGFFDGALNLTADYYIKTTTDLLLNVQLPLSSGFSESLQNIGSVQNRGLETALNVNIFSGDFSWSSDLNIAWNRNEITDLGDEKQRFVGANFNILKGQPATVLQVGQPVGNFFGYATEGYFQTQEESDNAPDQRQVTNGRQGPGARKFIDQNNDGVVNEDDRVILGNSLPDFTGGFTNTFRYKNLDLNFLFQFSVGNDVMNLQRLELEFLNGRQNQSTSVLNRWSPQQTAEQNSTAETSIASRPGPKFPFRVIDRWVEDASFLRLRNINLGYTIPLDNIEWIRDLRVYVSGQNLLTFTDYSGFDPEVNISGQDNLLQGFDYGSYPTSKTYLLGVNLKF